MDEPQDKSRPFAILGIFYLDGFVSIPGNRLTQKDLVEHGGPSCAWSDSVVYYSLLSIVFSNSQSTTIHLQSYEAPLKLISTYPAELTLPQPLQTTNFLYNDKFTQLVIERHCVFYAIRAMRCGYNSILMPFKSAII